MKTIDILQNKLNALALWEEEVTLERNHFLKVSGSIDTNLYYVVSGSLRMYTISEYEEHTIRFGYRGSFIAALDSFITQQPSMYYIQALKKSQFKVISKARFDAFIHSQPEHLQLWNELLGALVVDLLEREQDILISSPLERYKRVLKRSPQLFQEIPHKYIAAYLRMTPETLSRLKKSN